MPEYTLNELVSRRQVYYILHCTSYEIHNDLHVSFQDGTVNRNIGTFAAWLSIKPRGVVLRRNGFTVFK